MYICRVQIRRVLEPTDRVINFANISKLLTTSLKKLEPIMSTLLHLIQKVGQNQLLRKHIHNTLQFTCQLGDHLKSPLEPFFVFKLILQIATL